jgi:hypothetical protein
LLNWNGVASPPPSIHVRKVYCDGGEVFLFILMIEEMESSALKAEIWPFCVG